MANGDYRITQVDEVTLLNAARNPVPGYRIYFTWGGGRTSSVDIFKSAVEGLSPDAVTEVKDQAVGAEIARMDALW